MINIINASEVSFPLTVRDLQYGHAYLSDDGILFIGNQVLVGTSLLVAFSVDGDSYVPENDYDSRFREVDIEVRILT